MTTVLQVFDRPMCCPTGVCGPGVDPVLPRFAADLDWLAGRGVTVERHNLAQQPAAFAQHEEVRAALEGQGLDCLPLFRVNEEVVFQGKYPSRSILARWCGVSEAPERPQELPVMSTTCCGSSGCC